MLWATLAIATPKVVGGTDAAPGDWPDAVALFAGSEYTCAGTLIAPGWVLSAAHCIGQIDRAVLGTVDRSQGGAERAVVGFLEHPDPSSTLDVALFELDPPVHSIAPRPLALDCLADLLLPDTPLTIAGWGYTDTSASQTTQILQQLQIPILDPTCADLERGCRSAVSPGGELVAGGNGLDSCTGDSGGPAYLDTPRGPVLAATVARAAIPSTMICGSGGIYVRTDAVASWIESAAGIQLPRPDCTGINRPPQPVVQPVELIQGETVQLQWDAGDPDGDEVTVTLRTPPERGRYMDGSFTAEPFQIGVVVLELEFTDSGVPPLSNRVQVPIQIYPAGHLPHNAPAVSSSCSTAPSAGLWLMAIGCCIARRRRRRHPADPQGRSHTDPGRSGPHPRATG